MSSKRGFVPIPFWHSMAWKRRATSLEFFESSSFRAIERRFQIFCSQIQPCVYSKPPAHSSIPPFLHFIWLGSKVPSKVMKIVNSWKKYHPGWKIFLWTDEKVKNFVWTSLNLQKGFEKANSWAEKADVLRIEILYQYGGVYSDTDVICLKPFHDLIANGLSFFAGLEINYKRLDYAGPFYVGSAILGSAKGSSILQYCMNYYKTAKDSPYLPLDLRAGPGLLSQACAWALHRNPLENLLILPCSYLYPLTFTARYTSKKGIKHFLSKESLAVHLWEGSWFIHSI